MFPVDQAKLHPRFEAYRLIQDDALSMSAHVLPSLPPSLPDVYASIPSASASSSSSSSSVNPSAAALRYKETKARALHQILVPAHHHLTSKDGTADLDTAPFAAYFDRDGFVVLLTYDASSDRVIAHPVHRLAVAQVPADAEASKTHGCQQQGYHRNLPSLHSVAPDLWIAADGAGSLHVLHLAKFAQPSGAIRWATRSSQEWTLPHDASEVFGRAIPFSIKARVESGADRQRYQLLLQASRTVLSSVSEKQMDGLGFQAAGCGSPTSSRVQGTSSQTVFDIFSAELDLGKPDSQVGMSDAIPLQVRWCCTGSEPLLYARLDGADAGGCRHILAAEASFHPRPLTRPAATTQPEDALTRSSEQSQLQTHATSTASSHVVRGGEVTLERRRAPHYSWAQTPDTVTLVFRLPASIDKSQIRAHFTTRGVSLSLSDSVRGSLCGSAPKIIELVSKLNDDGHGLKDEDEDEEVSVHAARLILSGRYVSRPTWAELNPEGSVWTWERVVPDRFNSGRVEGILTLHLEKKHEGTRWMQVFANRSGSKSKSRSQVAEHSAWEKISNKTRLTFSQARERVNRVARSEVPADGKDDGVSQAEIQARDCEYRHEDEDEDSVTEDDGEYDEDDVPETLDPSELITMLEGMDKYTVDEQDDAGFGLDRTGIASNFGARGDGDGSSIGLSFGQPSLLKDSLEDEDDQVGTPLVITRIDEALRADESGGLVIDCQSSSPSYPGSSSTLLLATPLPTSRSSGRDADTATGSLVVKHDLDGMVFEPLGADVVSSTHQQWEWQHSATMPALAFVLASKKDAQRVYVHASPGPSPSNTRYAVLAFESAPRVTGSESIAPVSTGAGNLFVYYTPPTASASLDRDLDGGRATKATYAPSRVVRLGSASVSVGGAKSSDSDEGMSSGSLLGVVAARLPSALQKDEDEEVLVCLCEHQILIVRGIF
ncbi:hypothetical protein BCV70DRAFT_198863 [Testicularia cyperi]|uniref:NudC domain-containing protein 1 n=1 Tax=Testicularia cyperi TaxID=1882483 RepID=A0A317XSU3_9BASI|nr:hypothetical protein BCV70DRAFT_198863 [Testicularia cyperi]